MNKGSVTILGCGSALPTYQNSPSGQVVTLCDKSFLIDCGEGIQITMRRLGVHTSRLYSVFISHLHGDHCFGLIGLISTLGMLHRTQPLHIYAHGDLEKLMKPWLAYYCNDLPFEVIFHPIDPRKRVAIFEDRTLTVETIPLCHSVPSCGFLFTEHHRQRGLVGDFIMDSHRRYAYCSDTRYSEKIAEAVRGVDVLYHEATYTDEFLSRCHPTMHSTAKQAATTAKNAGAKQLIIGHFSARVDDHEQFLKEAKTVFDNTILAKEKESYEI